VGAGLATVLGNVQVVLVPLAAWLLLSERPAGRIAAAVPIVLIGSGSTKTRPRCSSRGWTSSSAGSCARRGGPVLCQLDITPVLVHSGAEAHCDLFVSRRLVVAVQEAHDASDAEARPASDVRVHDVQERPTARPAAT
jgi:hypothetical protein